MSIALISHLRFLEAEAIHILRETAAQFRTRLIQPVIGVGLVFRP